MKALKWSASVIGGLLLVGVVTWQFLDPNRYREQIGAAVSRVLDRKLVIEGEISLVPSWVPTIGVGQVTLANASWAEDPLMVSVGRLEVSFDLLALLRGRVDLRSLLLTDTSVLIEVGDQAQVNWALGMAGQADAEVSTSPTGGEASVLQSLETVDIRSLRLVFRDHRGNIEEQLDIDSLSIVREDPETLRIRSESVYRQQPVGMDLLSGRLTLLAQTSRPWPLQGKASIGHNEMTFDGALRLDGQPWYRGKLTFAGSDAQALATVLDVELPDLATYQVAATAEISTEAVRLAALSGVLGDTRFEGEAALAVAGERARLTGTLALDAVTVDEGGAESKPAATADRGGLVASFFDYLAKLFVPRREAGDVRIIPAVRVPLPDEIPIDLDFSVTAQRIVGSAGDLRDVDLRIQADQSRIELQPANLRLYGGSVKTGITIEAGTGEPTVMLKASVDSLDLGALIAGAGGADTLTGKLDLLADINGRGVDLRQLLASSGGQFNLMAYDGSVAGRMIDLWATGLIQTMMPDPNVPKRTRINCLLAGFGLSGGLASSDSLLLDTDYITVRGAGTINLASEQLDLVLTPKPKDAALLSLATPVNISGALASPSVSADKADLATKVGTLAVVGLSPVGFLAAFGSAGTGEANPCATAVSALEEASAGGDSGGRRGGVVEGLKNLFK